MALKRSHRRWIPIGGPVLIGFAAAALRISGSTVEAGRTQEWKTYRSEEYGFEISYPESVPLLTGREAGHLRSRPLSALWLMMGRSIGPEANPVGSHTAPIVVAVYRKPDSTPVREWLFEELGTDLAEVETGTIDTAYERATDVKEQQGEKGVVTYRRVAAEDGVTTREVGWVRGKFGYGVFKVKQSTPYIYAVTFELEEYGLGDLARPTDQEYMSRFEAIARTLELY